MNECLSLFNESAARSRARISERDTSAVATELNALPLLLTISETFTDAERDTSLQDRLVHAAVHGWMEGHLSSPGHRLDPDNVSDMPEPALPPSGRSPASPDPRGDIAALP
jgi:hypothetical protein